MSPQLCPCVVRVFWCVLFLLAALPLQGEGLSPLDQTSNEELLKLPRLRGVYRQCFRWRQSLREDGETTATIKQLESAVRKPESVMALAALVASADELSTPLLSQEAMTQARAYAIRIRADQSREWGAEPILVAVTDPTSVSLKGTTFAEFVLDQLRDDDIRNNASTACEIYYTALQEIPDTFLPPLVARVASLTDDSPHQEMVLYSSLLLLHSTKYNQDKRVEKDSWFRKAKLSNIVFNHANFQRMTESQRTVVLEAAQRFAGWSKCWDCDESQQAFAIGNRGLAWSLLEDCGRAAIPYLRNVSINSDARDEDRSHAIAVWLLVDDSSLCESTANSGIMAQFVAEVSRATRSLLTVNDPEESSEEETDSGPDLTFFHTFCGHDFQTRFQFNPLPRIDGWRRAWCRAAAERLEVEADAQKQMRLASFLVDCRDEKSRDLVAEVCLSNLVNDDVDGNNGNARYLLDRLKPDVEFIRAGLNVAVHENDTQMFVFCASYLKEKDETFNPADEPELLAFAASKFGDDSEIRALLREVGPAAKPFLTPLLEAQDEWESRHAEMVIRDIDFIEALRRRGRKVPYNGATFTIALDATSYEEPSGDSELVESPEVFEITVSSPE